MIKQYIRSKDGRKIGMITALISGDCALIGFSKCKKTDKFSREIGEIISDVRAKASFNAEGVDNLPHDVKKAIPVFFENHKEVLSGKRIPAWTIELIANKK